MKITLTCTASGTSREVDPNTELLVAMRAGFEELPQAVAGAEMGGSFLERMSASDFLLEFQASEERDMLNRGRTPRAMLGHSRKWYVFDPGMDTYWATTVRATGELDAEVPILDPV